MAGSIKNQLKLPGVFKCHHPAHKQFGYNVSPYHIFVEKSCFPGGCVEFLWRCHNFEKGKKCPKNYKHVGRGCSSCKKFHDEKMHYEPTTNLNENELRRFLDDLKEYRGWLEDMANKRTRFSGVLDSITPHLMMTIENGRNSVVMDGFYASFRDSYFNNDHFEDNIYMRLSGNFLSKTKLAPGDEFESDAVFTEDRGRIIMRSPRNIDIERNGENGNISPARARIARATGKIIQGPIEKCKTCEYCSLIDIEDRSRRKTVRYRRFYCLRGITDSENCVVRLEENYNQRKNISRPRF